MTGDIYKAGSLLVSTTCATQVIVVKPPRFAVDLSCGGQAMLPATAPREANSAALNPSLADGTLLGKRYIDEESGLEVLCTKSGAGSLSIAGKKLVLKPPAQLPSSD